MNCVTSGTWNIVVGLFVLVLLAGMGLAAALALGWRSQIPRRDPDHSLSDLHLQAQGDGIQATTAAGYRVRLARPGQHGWASAGVNIGDFEVEVEVISTLPSEDVGFGLLYRYQDPDNHYLFAIGGDGYYTVALVRAGEISALREWEQFPHIRRGAATNRLRVHCRGSRCRFYINDEFAAEIDEGTYSRGDLALWAQTFSDRELELLFTSFRVWSVEGHR
jgi:hypothetical protein